ncbi:MAG: hypothetical protein E6H79_18555 [Betaproteobacteria bacterium]|nr:MAG: hypothetical protein E6H79_18555 [Betaproteobacteria bacterium]
MSSQHAASWFVMRGKRVHSSRGRNSSGSRSSQLHAFIDRSASRMRAGARTRAHSEADHCSRGLVSGAGASAGRRARLLKKLNSLLIATESSARGASI